MNDKFRIVKNSYGYYIPQRRILFLWLSYLDLDNGYYLLRRFHTYRDALDFLRDKYRKAVQPKDEIVTISNFKTKEDLFKERP